MCLEFTRQLQPIVAPLLPALAQVWQVGIELTLTSARGRALRKPLGRDKAMDHLPTEVQLPSDLPLAESLAKQGDNVLIASIAVGAADLPTLPSSCEHGWTRCCPTT